ncbi:hypothetical protein H6A05_01800 [Megasphaera elsdenii]|uniref:hypothetical protein n=1 Tax=Megasphaera elsdenii TaxID=907 RepID=UPI00195A7718|nr:hypothetical protein [Megasphaera elsdenii]MBM6701062.1 hypothetical protein [Megasphaera elsdenii]
MAGRTTEDYLQALYDRAAANDQYIDSVIAPDDGGTYDYLGDGGYLDSGINAVLHGLGGALGSIGTYTNQEFGFGQGLEDFGDALAQGRQARQQMTLQDFRNDPVGYMTNPNGFLYNVLDVAGASIPDIAATVGVGAATGGIGGAAVGLGLKAAKAARLAKTASRLEKAIAAGEDASTGLGIARKAFGTIPEVAGNVAGGYLDAASEAGDTYNQAIQMGYSQDEARNAMDSDFMDNLGLSVASNAVSMGMLKGAANAPKRFLSRATESTEQEAGKGLLGSLSDFGGKVADFADKRYATRVLAHGVPGTMVESYTEGLQNEFQNNALTGEDINYNPFDMNDESKEQMGMAGFAMTPMALLGGIGHRRARRVSPADEVSNPVEGANSPVRETVRNTPDTIQREAPAREDVEATENIPIDETELTQQDLDAIPMNSQEAPATQPVSEPSVPTGPKEFTQQLLDKMNNPTEYDLAEQEAYGKSDNQYQANQAIANLIDNGEASVLGYNPVHGTSMMTGPERDDLVKAMIESPNIPIISDNKSAQPVAAILQQRNNDRYRQATAQTLIQKKKELGLPVSQQELDNANSISPNTGFFPAQRKEIHVQEVKNRKANKEQHAKNIATAVNAIQEDIKQNGTHSDFYKPKGGYISDAGKARLNKLGLTPDDAGISKTLRVSSAAATHSYETQKKGKQKATEQVIKDDFLKNGVHSKYYTSDGKFDSLPNEVKQEITKGAGGEVTPKIRNQIKALSGKARSENRAKTQDIVSKKNHMDTVQHINSSSKNRGVTLDAKKMEGLSVKEQRHQIEMANAKIAKRDKIAEVDAVRGFEKQRVDKSHEVTIKSPFAQKLSQYANKGRDKEAITELHNFTENFFNYKKGLSMSRLLSKFPKKYRESVKEAVTSYVNARTRDKYDPQDHIQNIQQKIAEVDRQTKQVSDEKNRERARRSYENKKEIQKAEPKPVQGSAQDLLNIMSKVQDDESKLKPEANPVKELSVATKAKKTRAKISEAKSKGKKEELKAVHLAGKALAKEIRGKHLAKHDPIHYFLHHEELEKKYKERAATLSKDKYKGVYIQRGNVEEHLVPDIVRWVNNGPVKVARTVKFPGDKALDNLVKTGKYTKEEVSKAKAEYEKYKKQAKEESDAKITEDMENKENSKANNADIYKIKTSNNRIAYNGDVAFKYNGDEVHSSKVDIDVKIPNGKIESMGTEVRLREANKDDIADYLSDYYNIDVDPDNIKITKDDEVHIKDGSRHFWKVYYENGDMQPCKIPEDVFARLSKEDQKQFLADGNLVEGEDKNDRKDTVTADAERSHEQRNLGSHVVQRNNGTSRRNDTGRSLGKTENIRRGIHRQIRGPKRGHGNASGLTGPEKKIQSSISILTSNGIPVSSDYSEKLIKDSFGKLPARLQSKIARAIDEMATAFVYYGDKSGDTLARNYSNYNIIRLFKTAFDPTVKDPTLLHELLHNFQAAIENDSGKKDYGMNYITTNHLVDWSKNTFKDWKLNYLDNLLEQLKNGEGLTKDWKILVYDHVRHNPKYIDYICYQISKDEALKTALKNSRKVYDELFVAKTLAQLNIAREIPEYRTKLSGVEKRLEKLIDDASPKAGVTSLNRSKLLTKLGVKQIFANGKLTKEAVQAFGDYKSKDKKGVSTDSIRLKERIDKQLHKVGIPTHEETAQRAALYAAGVLPGKERMNILQRQFEDPLHIFKKYFPDGMPIYRLADGARRKMEKFVGDYSQKFLDVFKGLDKDERKVFDSLVLKANEMHRDPMQVINLDDGIHLAARHDAFIEHYDSAPEALKKMQEIRNSGKYRLSKMIQESDENENAGFGKGFTVFALPKGSAAFKSEAAAQEYAKAHEKEAYVSMIRSLSDKPMKSSQVDNVMNSFMKYRDMMDKVYETSAQAAKESGANYKLPKKLNGYFPQIHLPYVVWVKDKDTKTFVRTSSFYNASEASKRAKELTQAGQEAYWAEINPINAMAHGDRLAKVDRMTEDQLKQLNDEGLISVSESNNDTGNYNEALKRVFNPLFKEHHTVAIKDVMSHIEKVNRYKSNTGSAAHDNYVKKLQSQIRVTGLYKKLQKMKKDAIISQDELNNIINSANMKQQFNPFFQKRTGASGYSQNVPDSVYRYLITSGNFISKAKFYAEATAYYTSKYHKDIREEATTNEQKFLKTYIEANHRPTSVTALDRMINDYMNLLAEKDPTGIGSLLRRRYGHNLYTGLAKDTLSLQNLLKLGLFRPASLAVQAFQVLNANAKLGGNKYIGMSKYFRTGLREATGSKYDEKWKELYDYIGINEKSVAIDSEILGRPTGVFDKKILFGKSAKDLADKSMWFFNVGDKWARKATAIGGYLKAMDDFKELSHDEKKMMLDEAITSWQTKKERARQNHYPFKDPKPTMESVRKEYVFNKTKDLVTETNFNYSVTDSPLAMTEAGVTGKLLLQFKKYPLFTLNFMLHNTKEENIRFLVPMFIMAGALGMPCVNLVDDIFDKTTGHSPVMALKRGMINWAGGSSAKRALVNVALYGAPSMAGINLSGNIGLGDAIQFDLGPTVSTVSNIAQGNGILRSLAPRLGALEEAVTGKKENKYGQITAKYTPYDQLLKVFGFRTMAETNSSDATRVMKLATQKYNECKSQAKKEYIKNPNTDNYEALKIYGMSDGDIAKLLKTKDTTAMETAIKTVPKKAKSPEAQEVRNLSKAAQEFVK